MSLEFDLQAIGEVLAGVGIALAIAGVAGSIVGAIRSGVIKQIDLMGVTIDLKNLERRSPSASPEQRDSKEPFEAAALASYYNQALSRTNVSFWFSIIFASFGFGVIIFAFLSHSATDTTGTVLKVVGGGVIEAVAGLFFALSNSAQSAMLQLFEKLRLDRASADAREMIKEISDLDRADQLRAQLILRYAGIVRLVTADAVMSPESEEPS